MTDIDNYTILIDYVSGVNPIYIGRAARTSATSAAVWEIKKLTYSNCNLTELKWAGGTDKFDKVWDDRAALSYS